LHEEKRSECEEKRPECCTVHILYCTLKKAEILLKLLMNGKGTAENFFRRYIIRMEILQNSEKN
jgi:hypothetical protein